MTLDRFNLNLTALRAVDPQLANMVLEAKVPSGAVVETARNGAPTLIWDGQSFHSRFDPFAEAEKLVHETVAKQTLANGAPLVFGLGLGYHLFELSKFYDQIMVFEPEIGLIRLAFQVMDFHSVMNIVKFITNAIDLPDPELTYILAHPPSVRRRRDVFESWHRVAPSLRQVQRDRPETVGRLRELWRRLEGAYKILGNRPDTAVCSTDDLLRSASSGRGELDETEIYLLLIRELRGNQ